jgi:hypothetical protein
MQGATVAALAAAAAAAQELQAIPVHPEGKAEMALPFPLPGSHSFMPAAAAGFLAAAIRLLRVVWVAAATALVFWAEPEAPAKPIQAVAAVPAKVLPAQVEPEAPEWLFFAIDFQLVNSFRAWIDFRRQRDQLPQRN